MLVEIAGSSDDTEALGLPDAERAACAHGWLLEMMGDAAGSRTPRVSQEAVRVAPSADEPPESWTQGRLALHRFLGAARSAGASADSGPSASAVRGDGASLASAKLPSDSYVSPSSASGKNVDSAVAASVLRPVCARDVVLREHTGTQAAGWDEECRRLVGE